MAKTENENTEVETDDFPDVSFVEASAVESSGRGRAPSAKVLKIRGILDQAVSEGKVASFSVPESDKDKWDYDIRRAAVLKGLPEVKISVRYNAITKVLSFGPRELFAKAE